VNELIREALHPYPEDLVIVTEVGARRTTDGGWVEALRPEELRQKVRDNLGCLGLDVLDVVNLRMPGLGEPAERSLAEPFEALAELQREGLVRHLGVIHVTARGEMTPQQSAALAIVARRLDASPAQVAGAWLLARSPNLLAIPGATSVAQLEENLAAAALVLGPVEMEQLDGIGAGAP